VVLFVFHFIVPLTAVFLQNSEIYGCNVFLKGPRIARKFTKIEISILPMAELIKDIHISSLHEKQFLNQTILQVLKS
jgi:hypothetical protein